MLKGGLGAAVIEAINNSDLENIKVKTFGYDDCFVKHGKAEEIEKKFLLDYKNLSEDILKILKVK